GLGAQRSPFFVILLDFGVLVVDMQARGDSLGDYPSPEPAWSFAAALGNDAPVEARRGVVGAAEVEVVAYDLLEEDPPGPRCSQHLGQREVGRHDRQRVAV